MSSVSTVSRGTLSSRGASTSRTSTSSSNSGFNVRYSEVYKPRITINKLVLNNFKSYFGRQEIGPFHKSFSAIVGPNGSGKSNVLDALLFVFGFRAHKMRQSKLSDLIHSSQECENLDECCVEIHFEEIVDLPGSDNFEVIPHSQLIISRRAYRNNTNKYFINNRQSNYTEVTKLLKEKGVDLVHKRFLILQGEVESISLMKPKAQNENEDGLLEYLEDIIGTAKYNELIQEANENVEVMSAERSAKLDRVKLIERQKKNLEERKKIAENFLRDENLLALKQSILYQRSLLDCKKAEDIYTRSVNQLKDKLREEQERYAQTNQDIKKLENEYEQSAKYYQELEKRANEILKELDICNKKEITLDEKKRHAISKQNKVTKTMSSDTRHLSEARTAIQLSEQNLLDQNEEMSRLKNTLATNESELETIMKRLQGKSESFVKKIEERQSELLPWLEKINAKQSTIDIAQTEYNFLKERIEKVDSNLKQAEEEVALFIETQRTKEQEILSVENLIHVTKDEIQQINTDLLDCVSQQKIIKSNLADARQREDEAKGSLLNSQSRDKVYRSLMELKNRGRINGLHDRLGNLGVIDDKYDIAISTACPSLDNIVVDSVEVGETCIEYLRRNNLGRAKFILLDKLLNMNMNKIQTPENVPRLFDLVRPKENKFASAFYSVMKNTLVAANLQQANRIAFGKTRYRVVTLDGNVIDESGTMSGGGVKVMKGAMNSKLSFDVTPEAVEKLKQYRSHLEEQWRESNEKSESLKSLLQEKKDKLPGLELELSKLKMDAKFNSNRITDTKKKISELQRQQNNVDDNANMERLQLQICNLTQDLSILKNQSSEIEGEIKNLKNKILEIGGHELQAQGSKVDQIKEQIAIKDKEILKLQEEKLIAERNIIKFENSIAKGERELEGLNNEIEQLAEEIEQKAEAARSIKNKADEVKTILDDKRIELDEIKKNLDKTAEITNAFKSIELEIQIEIENNENHLAENRKSLVRWQNSLSTLSLHKIGDEEEQDEFQVYTDDELNAISNNDLRFLQEEIYVLEEKIKKANPNLSVLDEYRTVEEEYMIRIKGLEEIVTRLDNYRKEYDRLRSQRLEEFMHGFTLISQKLKEMYQMITLGGSAELECCDSLDPFSEGINFSVMPRGKSWKNIANLSGGEKTLSSLALVFALHHFKPTPIYVMDEIDAALDFLNVSIIANYIKENNKGAQFIVISLRNDMFEKADHLVGIFKINDKTKSITIDPHQISKVT